MEAKSKYQLLKLDDLMNWHIAICRCDDRQGNWYMKPIPFRDSFITIYKEYDNEWENREDLYRFRIIIKEHDKINSYNLRPNDLENIYENDTISKKLNSIIEDNIDQLMNLWNLESIAFGPTMDWWPTYYKFYISNWKKWRIFQLWFNNPEWNNFKNFCEIYKQIIELLIDKIKELERYKIENIIKERKREEQEINNETRTIYDKDWYDKNWFNKEWYDRDNYDKEWYDKNWFDRLWSNKVTWTWFDINWYDQDWYDKDWYDKYWYDRNWYNREWLRKPRRIE